MSAFELNALTMWRQLPWAGRFAITAVTAIVVLLVLIWALTGFGGLGLDARATVGAVLGIVFAIGLAVALMTLIFYSNRGGTDDLVADAGVPGAQDEEERIAPLTVAVPSETLSRHANTAFRNPR